MTRGTSASSVRQFWAPGRMGALAVTAILLVAGLALATSAQNLVTADLDVARLGHTATELADGRILIVGGENAGGPVSEAEILDPASGALSITGNSGVARADHACSGVATAHARRELLVSIQSTYLTS